MKFDIIIPVHNARNRIDTIINRLKGQTFKDFRAIYVVDASDDGSYEYICQNHKDAVVIETDYGNDGLARSAGLDVATAEWVMFIDDDDDWNSNEVLETIAQSIDAQPDEDIICCGFNWHGVGQMKPQEDNGFIYPNVWSKIWRCEAIGDTRFPNKYPDADLYFSQEMFSKPGIRIVTCNYSFYEYNYLREGSISWKEQRGET